MAAVKREAALPKGANRSMMEAGKPGAPRGRGAVQATSALRPGQLLVAGAALISPPFPAVPNGRPVA